MRAVLVALACLAWGCARPPVVTDLTDLPRLPAAGARHLSGWKLEGELRGPLRAWGPSVAVTAWVRADGWTRVELHLEENDVLRRDTLIWSPQVALLVDGRTRAVKPLGSTPGDLDFDGGSFRIEHALWIAMGRLPRAPSQLEWTYEGGDWRGRSAAIGLRGQLGRRGYVDKAEVVWRHASETRHLRSRVEARDETGVPTRLSLSGSGFRARVVLEWSVKPVAMIEDMTFDPLLDPPRELSQGFGG